LLAKVEATRIRKAADLHPAIDAEVLVRQAVAEHGDGCVVAWSGGRCSTAVLHLTLKHKPDIRVVFCNTGVEYPETYRFINRMRLEWNLNFYQTFPIKSFWECVEEYGLPLNRSMERARDNQGVPKCCIFLKEKPMQKFIKENGVTCVITGMRVAESRMRFLSIRQRGQYFYSSRWKCWRCHPIAFWSEADLKAYIEENGVPLNCIYQKIPRCGCMPCTGFVGWEKQLSITNPRLYEYVQLLKGQRLMTVFRGEEGA